MQTIRVNLGPRSYDIAIGGGIGDRFAAFVRDHSPQASRSIVITDENLRTLAENFADALGSGDPLVVPAGEESKSLAMASELYERLADDRVDRRTAIVAVGGGVVGDLAGFVAATYNRGLPLIMAPTTLLAMVDSSVGGKVGINLRQGKNLVGAFHQPAGVWIDAAHLDSLPDREYRSGLAEVVKYGVILDAEFFSWLERNADAVLDREQKAVEHVIARSCQLKARVVEQDEREETGLRAILNYGHTFAHAFEAIAGYGAWLHGEAVAAGMICASRVAERRQLIRPDVIVRQLELLTKFSLPTACNSNWDVDAMLLTMSRDKKNVGGRVRLVLPTRIGEVKLFDDTSDSLIREVLTPS